MSSAATALAWGPAWEHDRQPARRRTLAVAAPPSRRRPDAAIFRRRRLVAGVLALAVATTAHVAVGWLGATAEAGTGAEPAAPVVLVARAGDTYWGLAGDLHRGGDLRSTVDALVRANGGRELRVGDRILLYR